MADVADDAVDVEVARRHPAVADADRRRSAAIWSPSSHTIVRSAGMPIGGRAGRGRPGGGTRRAPARTTRACRIDWMVFSSSCLAWPVACTSSMPECTTSHAEPHQAVDHLGHVHLVARDRVRAEDHGVVGAELEPLDSRCRHQRQRRHRLALRAGRDDADPAGVEVADVVDVAQLVLGDAAAGPSPGPGARSSSSTCRAWRRPGRWRWRRRRSAGRGGCGWRSRR